MKQPKNLNFGSVYDIMSIFRTSWNNLVPEQNQSMVNVMKKADKNATVHFYPLSHFRKEKIKTLADWCYSYWQQVYFSVLDNKVHYALGRGSGSGTRENHNFFINAFLEDEELKKKDIITSVLVSYENEALAYYFHKGYAYVNSNIGSNWEGDIRTKLDKSRLPYSDYSSHPCLRTKIDFCNNGKRKNVYHAMTEDITAKNFHRLLKSKKF